VTAQGRTREQKALYSGLAERLAERGLVDPADLVISISENTHADRSFGFGRAQFLTGELWSRRDSPGDSGPRVYHAPVLVSEYAPARTTEQGTEQEARHEASHVRPPRDSALVEIGHPQGGDAIE
jgi:hypothetical protein